MKKQNMKLINIFGQNLFLIIIAQVRYMLNKYGFNYLEIQLIEFIIEQFNNLFDIS